MKYITKKIYYSNQFYAFFLHGPDEEDILNDNLNVQNEYRFYMNRDFNEWVYDYKKVKSILFDQNNNLCILDVAIYRQLFKIANDYKIYQEKQFSLLRESTQKTIKYECSEKIKFLADYKYHDCSIVDICLDGELLTIEFNDFSWRRHTSYIFIVKELIHDIPIKELKKFNVLYEEVLRDFNDSIYEYNILLRKWGDNERVDQIEEISIRFTDIKSIIHTDNESWV